MKLHSPALGDKACALTVVGQAFVADLLTRVGEWVGLTRPDDPAWEQLLPPGAKLGDAAGDPTPRKRYARLLDAMLRSEHVHHRIPFGIPKTLSHSTCSLKSK